MLFGQPGTCQPDTHLPEFSCDPQLISMSSSGKVVYCVAI